jgi:hypothetical protein
MFVGRKLMAKNLKGLSLKIELTGKNLKGLSLKIELTGAEVETDCLSV